MSILDERGFFWRRGEPIPDRQLLPNSCVAGHLIIDEQGLSHLELDGALAGGERSLFPRVGSDPAIQEKSIQGLLKGNNHHVLLSNLHRDGGIFSTAGLSYERYVGHNCIVSDIELPEKEDVSHVASLEVDLNGFEEWLGLGSIDAKDEPDGGVSAVYHKQVDQVYSLANGKLTIRHDINRPSAKKARRHAISLKEAVFLEYAFSEKLTIEAVKDEYRLLEELLIILTNSEYSLDWPSISAFNGARRYRLYFWRHRNPAPAPGVFECYPNFNLIRASFGDIFARWKDQHGELGPAIYLYLGMRRGRAIYPENRFVNLIWAMETFHRIRNPEHPTSVKLKARALRILTKFKGEAGEDKTKKEDLKWLTGKLKHLEPSLEDRIFEIVQSLPLGLDKKKVRSFAKSCAARRNEISHHGGHRHSGSYTDFIIDLEKKSDALGYLHHTLILQELQLGDQIVSNYIYNNYKSYLIKHALVEVGLLDKSALKPPEMPFRSPV